MKFINTKTGEELAVRQGVILSQGYFSGIKESNLDVCVVQRENNKYFLKNLNGGLFTILSSKRDPIYVPAKLKGEIHSGDSIHRGKYYIKVISGYKK